MKISAMPCRASLLGAALIDGFQRHIAGSSASKLCLVRIIKIFDEEGG